MALDSVLVLHIAKANFLDYVRSLCTCLLVVFSSPKFKISNVIAPKSRTMLQYLGAASVPHGPTLCDLPGLLHLIPITILEGLGTA